MNWIKVEDQLPETYIPVLTTGKFRDNDPDSSYTVPSVCRRTEDGTWMSDECFDSEDYEKEFSITITHWMPLPKLPNN